MKVRLSYSAELSEVSSKVAEMLEAPDKLLMDSPRKIDLITDILMESDGKYAEVAMDMIDNLRRELSTADQSLMECQTILEGYVRAMNPEPEAEPPPAPKKLSEIKRGQDAVKHMEDSTEQTNVSSR